jgi:type III restriction enzyme
MPLSPDFPTDPHAILDPAIRWYPGDEMLGEIGYALLLPPLVHKVRAGVKVWRDKGYAGACATTRALLDHWFRSEHLLPQRDGTMRPFAWYFAQREAVETAIWLYEIERARDPYALMRYDSSGGVSRGMFFEQWTRYVLKLATGAGKTKVMSLLIAWSYFHKLYEIDSDLSTNFLLIAPNIIVLDRLRVDFDGVKIFFEDPILPANGHEGRNWGDDFQLSVHIQDDIGHVAETGNLFLTNIHRVYEGDAEPSFEDEDTTSYFLGRKPVGKTTDSTVDLGVIIREVPDLVVLNDEAHHLHDRNSAWFKAIESIDLKLRQKGSALSVQLDLTATPKDNRGSIFVQTVSDYPLVEAIRQQVVKTPVLPDAASRAKLVERQSAKFTEQYEDYLDLGYREWKKVYDELVPTGKKSVLFVMTDDTKNCDEVAAFLESHYPELHERVLVIHTKNNGEISEAASGKSKEELDKLRKASREIDDAASPWKAVVSVMVLREGWDVQNVVTIVGLRPYTSKARILPEQTLGRGLRRMFRGQDVPEKVSVVGTQAFIEFVEGIKVEGVELEYQPMGRDTGTKSPLVVEVETDSDRKDIEALDIELPVLAPRIYREFKNLDAIDPDSLGRPALPIKPFSQEEQREIVFRDIDKDEQSHVTVIDTLVSPSYQNVIGWFTRTIMRDLRLVGGFDVLFGKIKSFIEARLFERPVDLADPNILRNLSEIEVTRALMTTIKGAVNALTVQDRGTTRVQNRLRLSQTRPFVVKQQAYVSPRKSIFNKIVGDSRLELEVAGFLDSCADIVSFAKNSQSTGFRVEYQNADGGIANYYPDFLIKKTDAEFWIVETKGAEDTDDPLKWERLRQWCADATTNDPGRTYRAFYLREEDWRRYSPKDFAGLIAMGTT